MFDAGGMPDLSGADVGIWGLIGPFILAALFGIGSWIKDQIKGDKK